MRCRRTDAVAHDGDRTLQIGGQEERRKKRRGKKRRGKKRENRKKEGGERKKITRMGQKTKMGQRVWPKGKNGQRLQGLRMLSDWRIGPLFFPKSKRSLPRSCRSAQARRRAPQPEPPAAQTRASAGWAAIHTNCPCPFFLKPEKTTALTVGAVRKSLTITFQLLVMATKICCIGAVRPRPVAITWCICSPPLSF